MEYYTDNEDDWNMYRNVIERNGCDPPVANIINEGYNSRSEETEYLAIRTDPIVLQDPGESTEVRRPPRPYLRRGSGLRRYNMTVDHFKKGPPDLYKNKEFKSFLKGSKKKPNTEGPVCKNSNPVPKTVKSFPPGPLQKNHPAFPERKFATQALKSFDDQVIPTLRSQFNSEIFEVPVLKTKQVKSDIPKTPMKKLVLKPQGFEQKENEIFEILEQRVEDSDFSVSNSSVQKLLHGEFSKATPTSRRLMYNEKEDEARQEICDDIRDVEAAVMRKRLTDHIKQLPGYGSAENTEEEREFPCFREPPCRMLENPVGVNLDLNDSEIPKRNQREIAEAMKRKGLTDNVKKHLAWNSSPRKRRPVCIVKKVKIKKPKPPKREKLNLHELRDKINQLEDVKNKLQLENYRIKRIEKDYLDEKIKLDKQRKETEKMLKEEKEKITEERTKLLEDQKKLRREKLAFETYCQETRNLPTRDEREEIRALKEEIEKLKEGQKTKETRTGATLAQLRNQIVLLRRENNELKKELEAARKVTVKKVSFDTDGVVKGKMIDALNKQMSSEVGKWRKPVSARERPAPRPAPLRRTKSEAELKKVAPKVVRARTRGVSSGPIVSVASENKPVNYADDGISDDDGDCPEVIDLVSGESSSYFKTNDCDSGVDTRPGSDEGSSRTDPLLENDHPVPPMYSRIFQNTETTGCAENVTTAYCTVSDGKTCSKEDCWRKTLETCSEWYRQRQRPDATAPCGEISNQTKDGCLLRRGEASKMHCDYKSVWRGCDARADDVCADFKQRSGWEKSPPVLNISADFMQKSQVPLQQMKFNTETRLRVGHCVRHKLPIKNREGSSDTGARGLDPTAGGDVVRTKLPGGDIQEEDRRTGIWKLWCGACGACEVTYLNRQGYRLTTRPDGNTMEEHPDGSRVYRFTSGEVVKKFPNGNRELTLPNGDFEVTTKSYRMLRTASGIEKIVYSDGSAETRCPSGRIRRKDRYGRVIMDTGGLLPISMA